MPLDPPAYLSASSIETFQTCPLKFKYSKIDQLPDQPGPAAIKGNFVHDVLEDLLKLPAGERTVRAAKEIMARQWDENWRAQIEAIESDPAVLKAFRWEAWWCVEGYFAIEDPNKVTPGGLESNLLLDPTNEASFVEVAGVPMKGFIDRWDITDRGPVVVDYKTGKTPWKKEWQDGKFQQLLIYADGLSQIIREPVVNTTLLFVNDQKRLSRDVTQRALDEMRSTVSTTYVEIKNRCKSGDFEARKNPLCGWCAYREICPAWN